MNEGVFLNHLIRENMKPINIDFSEKRKELEELENALKKITSLAPIFEKHGYKIEVNPIN